MPFADRDDAGRRLAERLAYLEGEDVVVLALPRGGVPVGAAVARALGAPLDVIVVRKLGMPGQGELAIGAIGEDGSRVVNDDIVEAAGLTERDVAAIEQSEREELARRVGELRRGRPALPLTGRTAVIVDDGMATGATARAACAVAAARGAGQVVVAVPVASPEAVAELACEVDVVCLEKPGHLSAVGQSYADFRPTPDSEVVRLLEQRAGPAPG